MNICKAFQLDDPNEAYNQMKLHFVEDYGDYAYGHYLHVWDDGWRHLCQCSCGGYVLVQHSEYISPDWNDDKESEYTDFFPISGPEEADELNRKYDGSALEMSFPGRYLCVTNGKVHWANSSKSDETREPEEKLDSADTEYKMSIKRPISEELFQSIADRIRNFRNDPADFLVLDLQDDPDMLFMQTVRCGDQWHVELAFDMDEFKWDHPLILGNELNLSDTYNLLQELLVEGKSTDDIPLIQTSFRHIDPWKKGERNEE